MAFGSASINFPSMVTAFGFSRRTRSSVVSGVTSFTGRGGFRYWGFFANAPSRAIGAYEIVRAVSLPVRQSRRAPRRGERRHRGALHAPAASGAVAGAAAESGEVSRTGHLPARRQRLL